MSIEVLNNPATFEQWASDYYEPAAQQHYDQAIDCVLKLLCPPPSSEILDAGCGTGVHGIRMARAGFAVRCIDISWVALDEARQRAQQAGIDHQITFERADLIELPYPDHTFHTIFSWGVLIHIYPMHRALRELVRVLKPGGRLAIQLTNRSAIDYRIESVARRILSKPTLVEHTPFGPGSWDHASGGTLWTIAADVPAVTRCLAQLGCRCIHRLPAEFTELQRRVRGRSRRMLRWINHHYFRLRLPAALARTNLLIFQKNTASISASSAGE